MTNPTFGEDDRFQVEFTARQAEQRNSSARLVVLGLLVLVICSFVWVWGWRAQSSAVAALKSRQRQQVNIEAMLSQIESLRAQGTTAGAGAPIIDMGSRLKRIADRVGLTDLPIPTEASEDARTGRMRFYRYENMTMTSPGPVLDWMATATDKDDGIDGLELYALIIDPRKEREEWTVSVHFRRWESAQ